MGQTATDKLISPIVGKAVTTEFDLDARIDTLEAGVPASEVTYTPAVGGDWVNPDPTLASGALDDLAARLTTAETAAGRGRIITATVGAEAADVIAITLAVDDIFGNDVSAPTRMQVALFTDANFTTAANAAAFPLTDGGDGTVEATDLGIVSVIVLTGGSSRVQLNCTDAAGASGSTLYGLAEVLSGSTPVFSARCRFTLTFDGV